MADLVRNQIPYGVQNFASLRERGLCYVDKTGYIRAYLMMSTGFMVRPEQELGHRFSDFSLFPDRALGDDRRARHSFVIELKYSKADESKAEVAAKRREALAQLRACSQDPALPSLVAGTPVHYLYVHYQDFSQIVCEEISL